jgi:predicted dehydrogenase
MIHDLDIILRLANAPVKAVHATGVAGTESNRRHCQCPHPIRERLRRQRNGQPYQSGQAPQDRVFQDDTYLSLDYMDQAGQLCRKVRHRHLRRNRPIDKSEPLAAELQSFMDCVRQHRHDPVVTARHGTEALRLAIAICQTIRENPS